MGALAARACLVLGLWVNGVQVAASEGDESLQCFNFSDMASVCTERIVMGMAGGSAILPCTFSLHSLSHQVHVEWRLQEVNKGLLIFNSSNNYTEVKFQDRLRLVGDPTRGEASISITNLKHADTNIYFCRIKEWERSEQRNIEYNYYDHRGTVLVVQGTASAGDGALQCSKFGSRASVCTERFIIGVTGGSALLPCISSVRSPSNRDSVEWRLKEVHTGPVLFNSSNSNYIAGNFRGRLRLVGDLGKGKASINITNLNRGDTNIYFCHIKKWEMSEQGNIEREYSYYDQHGTRLFVQGTQPRTYVRTYVRGYTEDLLMHSHPSRSSVSQGLIKVLVYVDSCCSTRDKSHTCIVFWHALV